MLSQRPPKSAPFCSMAAAPPEESENSIMAVLCKGEQEIDIDELNSVERDETLKKPEMNTTNHVSVHPNEHDSHQVQYSYIEKPASKSFLPHTHTKTNEQNTHFTQLKTHQYHYYVHHPEEATPHSQSHHTVQKTPVLPLQSHAMANHGHRL